jgi:cytochrome P450
MTKTDEDLFATLMSPAARADPYPVYARLRRKHRVADTSLGISFVFGHAECLSLLRDRRASVDESRSGLAPPEDTPTLIHLDPPDHDRLRRLVQVAFTPRRVQALRARAQTLVDATLDRFGTGDEIDLISDLAYPVPLTIICELLGVDAPDRDLVREWSTWLARSIDPGVLRSAELNELIDVAGAEFTEYVRDLVTRRRSSPGDDLLSQLVVAEMDGDHLDERELLGLALLLLVAGHETTVSLIGNSMYALLRNPAQFAAVGESVSAEGMVPAVIDELLRFDSPVQMTSRIALETIDLPTATIAKGQVAILMLGAANHDPDVFERPDELDVTVLRTTPHIAFGSGIHHCLGAALARAEAEVAVTALVRRFPTMELLREPTLRPTFVLRGREHLRVRL